jgi:uncharacterized protein YdeI (YjbR/CyaY-like superfamily)
MLDSVGTSARFFASPSEFRSWLEKHHDQAAELWVGFYKKSSGRPSITWPEAVDEALCFGWIDGIRRTIDEERYANRFTPRRARSNWSAVNIKRVEELTTAGRMRPSGVAAFERRGQERPGIYSYEQRHTARLAAAQERRFRANKRAWEFFTTQSASYRTMAIWWVVSAKKDETRAKRLATLVEDSANGRRIKQLTRPPKA